MWLRHSGRVGDEVEWSERRAHWEQAHTARAPEARSWFQVRPQTSLELLELAGVTPDARVVDVGGGTSRLVDELLRRGFRSLTIVDISAAALAEARARLTGPESPDAAAGEVVSFVETDVTGDWPGGAYDVWHDRAMFHFLTEPADRERYLARLQRSLVPGGYVIMATFGPDGPDRCSGLPVLRYDLPGLACTLGPALEPIAGRREAHVTPAGVEQRFVYGLFQKRS